MCFTKPIDISWPSSGSNSSHFYSSSDYNKFRDNLLVILKVVIVLERRLPTMIWIQYMQVILHNWYSTPSVIAVSYDPYDSNVKSILTYNGTITKRRVTFTTLIWVVTIALLSVDSLPRESTLTTKRCSSTANKDGRRREVQVHRRRQLSNSILCHFAEVIASYTNRSARLMSLTCFKQTLAPFNL